MSMPGDQDNFREDITYLNKLSPGGSKCLTIQQLTLGRVSVFEAFNMVELWPFLMKLLSCYNLHCTDEELKAQSVWSKTIQLRSGGVTCNLGGISAKYPALSRSLFPNIQEIGRICAVKASWPPASACFGDEQGMCPLLS